MVEKQRGQGKMSQRASRRWVGCYRLVLGLLMVFTLICGGIIYGARGSATIYSCLSYLDSSSTSRWTFNLKTGQHTQSETMLTKDRRAFGVSQVTVEDKLSPDGNEHIYAQTTSNDPDNPQPVKFFLKATRSSTPMLLEENIANEGFGFFQIAWSSDSRWVAYRWLSENALQHQQEQEFVAIASADGHYKRQLELPVKQLVGQPHYLQGWTADNAYIILTSETPTGRRLLTFSVPDLSLVKNMPEISLLNLTSYEEPQYVFFIHQHQFVYLIAKPTGTTRLVVASAGDEPERSIFIPAVLSNPQISQSSDGRYLSIFSNRFSYKSSPARLDLFDINRATINNVSQDVAPNNSDGTATLVTWSHDSRSIFYAEKPNPTQLGVDLVVFEITTGRHYTVASDIISAPMYSPDRKFALVAWYRNNTEAVGLADLSGQRLPTTIVANIPEPFGESYPYRYDWSPDSAAVLVISAVSRQNPFIESQTKLTLMRTDELTPHAFDLADDALWQWTWSDDHRWLVYSVLRGKQNNIEIVDTQHNFHMALVKSLPLRNDVQETAIPLSWSPDGLRLAFSNQSPVDGQILEVANLDGTTINLGPFLGQESTISWSACH